MALTSLYRHIVLFAFQPNATPKAIAEVEAAFAELPSKIDTIVDLEWGTDVSPEGKAQGFTHAFFLTFQDRAGFEVYLPHPEHQAFSAKARQIIEKVLVLDYQTR